MDSHLVRLSGLAGDVLGNGEAIAPPKQLHTLTLTQKLELVVNNEHMAGRADHQEIAGAALAIFCDTMAVTKHPQESWSDLEYRAMQLLRHGFHFMKRNIEERRAGS